MARRAYGLHFCSPLHISAEQGVGLESTLDYIPSDTLFSALFITWLQLPDLRHAVLEWLEPAMRGALPLRITSAFPRLGQTLLLPRPRLLITPELPHALPESAASPKKYKKVRWVSPQVFVQMTQPLDAIQLGTHWAQAQLIQGGTAWLDPAASEAAKSALIGDEAGRYWFAQSNQTPRVTVDRWSSASNLFHVGRVHFAPQCGLWFMAEGDERWLDAVERALDLLGDSGIGGQRSRGNGQFTWQPMENLPTLTGPNLSSNCAVLLSRVAPQPDEMRLLKDEHASYDLVNVGGYCGTQPIIRCRVRLLTEGSIIGPCTTIGQLVDVKPTSSNPAIQQAHAIWRYGCGFVVPMQMGENYETDL